VAEAERAEEVSRATDLDAGAGGRAEAVRDPPEEVADEQALLLAYARLYDERGGGEEVEIKESKQGLGVTRRRKKSFAGQQMEMLHGTLAHNVVVWSRRWPSDDAPKLRRYGVLRVVRDVL
jgi:hypothetical protein